MLGVRVVLVLLVLLAPVKFGSVVGITEISLFPVSTWGWVFAAWPPFLFPVCTGLALAIVAAVHPTPRVPDRQWLLPGVWLALVLFAAIGLLRTTEWDYALLFLWHLLGIACFALAVFWALATDRHLGRWLLAAVALGTVLACLSGWQQRLGGLQATLEFAEKQARDAGLPPPLVLRRRIGQGRIFGPFVYPNSFAAHLLLTGPILLAVLWYCAGFVAPAAASRVVFVGAGSVLLAAAFWWTSSRAAFVALTGGLGLGALALPAFRRWRVPVIIAAVVLACLVVSVASRGRSRWASVVARGHYYSAALRMTAQHPVTGVGLGEFFPHFMRLKPPNTEEARLPHSMPLNLLSQAGILGGLVACACLLVPLVYSFHLRRRRICSDGAFTAFLVAFASWQAHTLVDFNLLIPGTVGIAALLPMLCLSDELAEERATLACRTRSWARPAAAALAFAALAAAWRAPGEYRYQLLSNWCARPGVPLRFLHERAQETAGLLPLSPHPWTALGRAAEKGQEPDLELALAAYLKAVRCAPHRPLIHTRLARCYLALGRPDEARRALQTALEWYPHSEKALQLREQL